VDSRRVQPGWWQALIAAAIAIVVDALYLAIIWSEGEGELTSARVLFVAACLAGAALALVWGLRVGLRARAILFAAAAGMLVVFTLLGAFSIGLLLAPAAVFAVLASSQVGSASRGEVLLAGLAPVALITAALFLT
jgi:hypothetical protein